MAQQLNNLTEREMLVLLIERMDNLDAKVEGFNATALKVNQLELRLLELEVKTRTWATVIGFLAGLGGSALLKLLNL